MYTSKSSKHMSAQIYKLEVLSILESNKDLCEKIREDMTGGISLVFF